MPKENIVEILYTEECPFWKKALELIEEIASDQKPRITVKKIKISTETDAKNLRFIGSPTIRINGVDIDPEAPKGNEGFVGCRIYRYKGRMFEYPPKEMIESAFERFLRK
jgi:hypothetical protein